MDRHFIQILLPLKLQWNPFYYSTEDVSRGQIVSVVFSGRRYNGVVYRTNCAPDLASSSIKQISSVRADLPTILETELQLWEFIASYYVCTIGEVFKAAYPVGKFNGEIMAAARTERLKKRLSAIEADLCKKHRDSVMQRLNLERDKIIASLPSPLTQSPQSRQTPSTGIIPRPMLITGPSRYEHYESVIKKCLQNELQVLLLSPETALCEQLADTIGIQTVVHHGKTDKYITGVSAALRQGSPIAVAGTRMAIFLPFSQLGAIIIDEEQDPSFKQNEPAPRYNARDCAVFMGRLHKCPVVLGSSLPSLESIYNCLSGKYSIKGGIFPKFSNHIEFIDIQAERKKNGMLGYFSRKLLERIGGCQGKICLIRGWENQEELSAQIARFFPEKEISIITLSELKKNGNADAILTAVLQIDALSERDDFRSDERMLQTVSMLEGVCCRHGAKLVIQTELISKFGQKRSYEALLEERREFGFPPFTRMVDVRNADGKMISRHFIEKGSDLTAAKNAIRKAIPPSCYLDVDP